MKPSGFSVLMAALLLLASSAVAGAQKTGGEKKKAPVPSLTTEDVVGDRVAPATVVESGDKTAAAQAKPGAGTGESPEKVSADEESWREQVKRARQKADSLQRQAEEAEISITNMRNQLNASGQTPGERNQVLQDMDNAGQKANALKDQAKQAKDELQKLLDDGSQKGYKESAGPSPTKGGAPNEDYYRSKFAALTQKLQDSQRQVELYDDQVKQINARINNNSGTGDNYYIGKLQNDLKEAQKNLNDAKDNVAKAQQEIDDLKEQARQAGVPPGVFRDGGGL